MSEVPPPGESAEGPEPAEKGPAPVESTDISGLPPVEYPTSTDAEFARWAAERRRRRIRTELVGGVVLVLLGVVVALVARSPGFLVLTTVLLLALGAFEFLTSSFE